MIRKARAVWYGTGRGGKGNLSSDSGVLADTPYSFSTRFEGEKGTNPEELIAAAHAGCFTMALAFRLQAVRAYRIWIKTRSIGWRGTPSGIARCPGCSRPRSR